MKKRKQRKKLKKITKQNEQIIRQNEEMLVFIKTIAVDTSGTKWDVKDIKREKGIK